MYEADLEDEVEEDEPEPRRGSMWDDEDFLYDMWNENRLDEEEANGR